jgi:hypothetical protein
MMLLLAWWYVLVETVREWNEKRERERLRRLRERKWTRRG